MKKATTPDGWTKKGKGNAKIYTHPNAFDGRAIVQNEFGFHFNGKYFSTLEEAKSAALRQGEPL